MPSRSLKLATDLRARQTAGFWHQLAATHYTHGVFAGHLETGSRALDAG
jgi:hypothetical protein